jgi:DNA-binding NarL/FixJ family response regulator
MRHQSWNDSLQSSMPIRVAIVEDDDLVRESLAVLISGASGFECISTHRSGAEAVAGIPKEETDVVLMDINLPDFSGIECTRQLKAVCPRLQIVMLTVYEDDEQVFRALAAGASGYLIKRTSHVRILEAVEDVHRGGSPMSSYIARKVVQAFQQQYAEPEPSASPAAPESANRLSQREEEILGLLSKGYRYKEIAEALSLSVETVRTHLRRIYEKLQVRSRTEAVVKFLHR